MSREPIKLRFWEDNGTLKAIAGLLENYWLHVELCYNFLFTSFDPVAAPLFLVDLIAWQRDIIRLAAEPEELYRRRVKYALANAKDAGSAAGFVRIWQRLELGTILQTERLDITENWDVVFIELNEEIFSRYSGMLEELIRLYGRTCRRYIFLTVATTPLDVCAANYDCCITYYTAKAGI